MLRQIITPVARTALKANRSATWQMTRMYHDPEHRQTTMDDLPVPQGSWEAQYKANQAKYNVHLLLGVACISITLITAKASGLVYLNWAPPELKD